MSYSAKELQRRSVVLLNHSTALRQVAEAARERGALLREQARKASELGFAARERAEAARKRQDAR
jgi:hypothetical protein